MYGEYDRLQGCLQVRYTETMADGDGDGDGDDEQRAEAVPNEIPNDCDMATELVPKEIETDT